MLRRKCDVLISDGANSRKTTLLNALVSLLPAAGRVISTEVTLELRQRPALRGARIQRPRRHRPTSTR